MTVKQISVFLENKPGALAELAEVLRTHDIDMCALSIAESHNFGVVRIIADAPERAQEILHDNGMISSLTPVIAVIVPDKPGALFALLELLSKNSINIEYSSAFRTRHGDSAFMVFRVADAQIAKTVELLNANNIAVASHDKIFDM